MNIERNKKIEEILNSLDGSQRAAAPDFFYTRLLARMEKGLVKTNNRNWILRPVYVVTALLIVLAVNTVVLLKGQNETTSTTADTNETVQQSIAAEYRLNDNNVIMYDINRDK